MLKATLRLLVVVAGIAVIAGAVHSGAFAPSSAAAAGDPTACVAALRADRTEALRIGQEQTDNFNATAIGSPYENALNAYHLALVTARTDFYKAFQYAYKGSKTTANLWIKNGNAQITKGNTAVKAYNAAIAAIDTATDHINADHAALDTEMAATDATCTGF
jgi:hypothetical protein